MDFILGMIVSWPVLILLVLSALLFEHNRHSGWATLLIILISAVSFYLFHPTWKEVGIVAVAWFPIGFLWSFWRFRKHVDKVVAKVEKGYDKIYAKEKIKVSNNIDNIVFWVIVWPVSFIETILGDVIDVITDLVKRVFRATYQKITDGANNRIDEIDHS